MKLYNWLIAGVPVCIAGFSGLAHAHYPHDVQTFIALSPDFSIDSTAFITSKQASSTRSKVALVSRNGGWSWEFNPEGMDNISEFTSACVSPFYSSDNTVFFTTEKDGVYRSTDGGRSWQSANTGLSALDLHDCAITADVADKVALFVSGMNGGLFKSTDSGVSWNEVLAKSFRASAMAVSPDYAMDNTVMAGNPKSELLVSTDGGSSFIKNSAFTGNGAIKRISLSPGYATDGELYIGTSNGLYHSNDAGLSFVKIGGFPNREVTAIAISPAYSHDRTVFVSAWNQLYQSTDGGQNWSLIDTGIEFSAQSSKHFNDIKLSDDFASDQTVFLSAFEGLFRSNDGGASWFELETRPPTLIMDAAVSPYFDRDGIVLVSTYGGGLYVSHDAGATWKVSNIGISGTYNYEVSIVEGTNDNPVLVASYDNHILISADRGASWTRKKVSGVLSKACIGSSMGVSPNFVFDQTLFLGCRKDGFVATHDAGETWQMVISGNQLAGSSIASVKLSPQYALDTTLIVTDQKGNFARSYDGGNSWQLAVDGLPRTGKWYGGWSAAFSPDFSNDGFLIAATVNGVYTSTSAGDLWSPLPDSAGAAATGVIERTGVSPYFTQDNVLLASVRGRGLYRSEDSGQSWQPVGTGLLDQGREAKGFVFSPGFSSDGVIIAFGHDRLLRSTDRGTTFELIDIPFVRHENDRKQSVKYKGIWGKISHEEASATTFSVIAAGTEVSMTFWGTGVSWVGVKANVLGIAEVYLDGSHVATVDQYSPDLLWQQALYTVSGLPEGRHDIQIIGTDKMNPDALSHYSIIDAFDVMR